MQIQLTDEQAGFLRRAAAERGVPVAAVIRELIDLGLRAPAAERARAAIGRFGSGMSRCSREHDLELDRALSE